jgi:hypothetical protein
MRKLVTTPVLLICGATLCAPPLLRSQPEARPLPLPAWARRSGPTLPRRA